MEKGGILYEGVFHKRLFDCLQGASWSCKMEGRTSGNLQMHQLASSSSFCRLVINPRIMSIPGSFGKYLYIRLMRAAYILQNVISSQMLYPAHCRKNVPLHLALQPRKILFYKIAPSQITVNKIILNYLQFQMIFFVLKSQFQMLVHPLRDVVIEGSDWGLTR